MMKTAQRERAARTMFGRSLDKPGVEDVRDVFAQLDEQGARLSSGEKTRVDLARQFWNGQGEVTIGQALNTLDEWGRLDLYDALGLVVGVSA